MKKLTLYRNDLVRLHECLTCPYLKRCERDVPDPEEYPDGRCKTKKLFQNGTMDFYKVEGYPPYRGY